MGGNGTVRFRNVRVKDLNRRSLPAEVQSPEFRKLQLDALYYSWGPAVADFNRDGKPDVVAGPFFYAGPDFNAAQEIYTPVAYNPAIDYPQKSFINIAYDFNKDGWSDVLTIGGSAGYSTVTLYLNPRGQSRHWDSCVVMKPIGNEETLFEDIDGDGRPELIHSAKNAMAYSTWDERSPVRVDHDAGVRAGPVGRLHRPRHRRRRPEHGWPQGPAQRLWLVGAARSGDRPPWTFHPQAFGRRGEFQGGAGGAQLGVYDVNGDGLNDVVTPLEGHGFGLAWYEQKRGPGGLRPSSST